MIDNFKLISDTFVNFSPSDNLFLHCQIIRRGKDHPNLPAANRTINQYFIQGKEHLNKIQEEIKQICEVTESRAYINVTPKSIIKALKLLNVEAAAAIYNNEQYTKPWKLFSSVVGSLKGEESRWILDIDEDTLCLEEEIEEWLNGVYPIGNTILAKIPTKSGIHFITKSFNRQLFYEEFPGIEIKTNNPTVLYIPNSLD